MAGTKRQVFMAPIVTSFAPAWASRVGSLLLERPKVAGGIENGMPLMMMKMKSMA